MQNTAVVLTHLLLTVSGRVHGRFDNTLLQACKSVTLYLSRACPLYVLNALALQVTPNSLFEAGIPPPPHSSSGDAATATFSSVAHLYASNGNAAAESDSSETAIVTAASASAPATSSSSYSTTAGLSSFSPRNSANSSAPGSHIAAAVAALSSGGAGVAAAAGSAAPRVDCAADLMTVGASAFTTTARSTDVAAIAATVPYTAPVAAAAADGPQGPGLLFSPTAAAATANTSAHTRNAVNSHLKFTFAPTTTAGAAAAAPGDFAGSSVAATYDVLVNSPNPSAGLEAFTVTSSTAYGNYFPGEAVYMSPSTLALSLLIDSVYELSLPAAAAGLSADTAALEAGASYLLNNNNSNGSNSVTAAFSALFRRAVCGRNTSGVNTTASNGCGYYNNISNNTKGGASESENSGCVLGDSWSRQPVYSAAALFELPTLTECLVQILHIGVQGLAAHNKLIVRHHCAMLLVNLTHAVTSLPPIKSAHGQFVGSAAHGHPATAAAGATIGGGYTGERGAFVRVQQLKAQASARKQGVTMLLCGYLDSLLKTTVDDVSATIAFTPRCWDIALLYDASTSAQTATAAAAALKAGARNLSTPATGLSAGAPVPDAASVSAQSPAITVDDASLTSRVTRLLLSVLADAGLSQAQLAFCWGHLALRWALASRHPQAKLRALDVYRNAQPQFQPSALPLLAQLLAQTAAGTPTGLLDDSVEGCLRRACAPLLGNVNSNDANCGAASSSNAVTVTEAFVVTRALEDALQYDRRRLLIAATSVPQLTPAANASSASTSTGSDSYSSNNGGVTSPRVALANRMSSLSLSDVSSSVRALLAAAGRLPAGRAEVAALGAGLGAAAGAVDWVLVSNTVGAMQHLLATAPAAVMSITNHTLVADSDKAGESEAPITLMGWCSLASTLQSRTSVAGATAAVSAKAVAAHRTRALGKLITVAAAFRAVLWSAVGLMRLDLHTDPADNSRGMLQSPVFPPAFTAGARLLSAFVDSPLTTLHPVTASSAHSAYVTSLNSNSNSSSTGALMALTNNRRWAVATAFTQFLQWHAVAPPAELLAVLSDNNGAAPLLAAGGVRTATAVARSRLSLAGAAASMQQFQYQNNNSSGNGSGGSSSNGVAPMAFAFTGLHALLMRGVSTLNTHVRAVAAHSLLSLWSAPPTLLTVTDVAYFDKTPFHTAGTAAAAVTALAQSNGSQAALGAAYLNVETLLPQTAVVTATVEQFNIAAPLLLRQTPAFLALVTAIPLLMHALSEPRSSLHVFSDLYVPATSATHNPTAATANNSGGNAVYVSGPQRSKAVAAKAAAHQSSLANSNGKNTSAVGVSTESGFFGVATHSIHDPFATATLVSLAAGLAEALAKTPNGAGLPTALHSVNLTLCPNTAAAQRNGSKSSSYSNSCVSGHSNAVHYSQLAVIRAGSVPPLLASTLLALSLAAKARGLAFALDEVELSAVFAAYCENEYYELKFVPFSNDQDVAPDDSSLRRQAVYFSRTHSTGVGGRAHAANAAAADRSRALLSPTASAALTSPLASASFSFFPSNSTSISSSLSSSNAKSSAASSSKYPLGASSALPPAGYTAYTHSDDTAGGLTSAGGLSVPPAARFLQDAGAVLAEALASLQVSASSRLTKTTAVTTVLTACASLLEPLLRPVHSLALLDDPHYHNNASGTRAAANGRHGFGSGSAGPAVGTDGVFRLPTALSSLSVPSALALLHTLGAGSAATAASLRASATAYLGQLQQQQQQANNINDSSASTSMSVNASVNTATAMLLSALDPSLARALAVSGPGDELLALHTLRFEAHQTELLYAIMAHSDWGSPISIDSANTANSSNAVVVASGRAGSTRSSVSGSGAVTGAGASRLAEAAAAGALFHELGELLATAGWRSIDRVLSLAVRTNTASASSSTDHGDGARGGSSTEVEDGLRSRRYLAHVAMSAPGTYTTSVGFATQQAASVAAQLETARVACHSKALARSAKQQSDVMRRRSLAFNNSDNSSGNGANTPNAAAKLSTRAVVVDGADDGDDVGVGEVVATGVRRNRARFSLAPAAANFSAFDGKEQRKPDAEEEDEEDGVGVPTAHSNLTKPPKSHGAQPQQRPMRPTPPVPVRRRPAPAIPSTANAAIDESNSELTDTILNSLNVGAGSNAVVTTTNKGSTVTVTVTATLSPRANAANGASSGHTKGKNNFNITSVNSVVTDNNNGAVIATTNNNNNTAHTNTGASGFLNATAPASGMKKRGVALAPVTVDSDSEAETEPVPRLHTMGLDPAPEYDDIDAIAYAQQQAVAAAAAAAAAMTEQQRQNQAYHTANYSSDHVSSATASATAGGPEYADDGDYEHKEQDEEYYSDHEDTGYDQDQDQEAEAESEDEAVLALVQSSALSRSRRSLLMSEQQRADMEAEAAAAAAAAVAAVKARAQQAQAQSRAHAQAQQQQQQDYADYDDEEDAGSEAEAEAALRAREANRDSYLDQLMVSPRSHHTGGGRHGHHNNSGRYYNNNDDDDDADQDGDCDENDVNAHLHDVSISGLDDSSVDPDTVISFANAIADAMKAITNTAATNNSNGRNSGNAGSRASARNPSAKANAPAATTRANAASVKLAAATGAGSSAAGKSASARAAAVAARQQQQQALIKANKQKAGAGAPAAPAAAAAAAPAGAGPSMLTAEQKRAMMIVRNALSPRPNNNSGNSSSGSGSGNASAGVPRVANLASTRTAAVQHTHNAHAASSSNGNINGSSTGAGTPYKSPLMRPASGNTHGSPAPAYSSSSGSGGSNSNVSAVASRSAALAAGRSANAGAANGNARVVPLSFNGNNSAASASASSNSRLKSPAPAPATAGVGSSSSAGAVKSPLLAAMRAAKKEPGNPQQQQQQQQQQGGNVRRMGGTGLTASYQELEAQLRGAGHLDLGPPPQK